MKRKREERRRLRRLKTKTLFMLSITLIFNAYAWFLYVTTVSTNFTVHVESWNINFESDNSQVEKEVTFNVAEAYPGMQNETKEVKMTNKGEKTADINYTFTRVRILNTEYVVYNELSAEEIQALTGSEIQVTQEELVSMLKEDFPFKLEVVKDQDTLEPNASATITVTFSWEYEVEESDSATNDTKDENDTKYGVDSYEYYVNNPESPAIQATIKILAQQHKE